MKLTPRLVAVGFASFVAGGLAPRAVLVVHDHAAGAAPHVHVGPLVPHRHEPGHSHVHAGATPRGAALALPHHVHTQHPFQHVDRPATPGLVPALCVVAAQSLPPQEPVHRAPDAARSRGPPLHAAS